MKRPWCQFPKLSRPSGPNKPSFTAVTTWRSRFTAMDKLIARLQSKFPALRFTPGKQFCWSPETGEIFYKANARGKQATWSLLHETGHALLEHHGYKADFELLR